MKAHVRIIEDQEEEIRDVNPLTEEETKAFLSKNHPDLYKQLYPNEVKPVVATPKKTIPKSSGDIQQTDKEYTYNKSTREYASNNPFAGYQFVTSMPKLTSQTKIKGVRGGTGKKTKGRLIFKAWSQDSSKVYDAILQAINSTAIQFNKSTEIKKAA